MRNEQGEALQASPATFEHAVRGPQRGQSGTPGRRRGAPRKRGPRRLPACAAGRECLRHDRYRPRPRSPDQRGRRVRLGRASEEAAARRPRDQRTSRRERPSRPASPASPRRGTSRGRRAKTAGRSGRWGGPGASCNTQEAGRRPPQGQAAKTRHLHEGRASPGRSQTGGSFTAATL